MARTMSAFLCKKIAVVVCIILILIFMPYFASQATHVDHVGTFFKLHVHIKCLAHRHSPRRHQVGTRDVFCRESVTNQLSKVNPQFLLIKISGMR